MEMQSQAPPRVRLCIAPDCPFRTVEAGNVPDGAVFAWALSYTIPQIVVAVVILVVALRLMREPKDEETEEADEQAEETDEQEIAEAIVEEENKEL